jgi:hypothetical protein
MSFALLGLSVSILILVVGLLIVKRTDHEEFGFATAIVSGLAAFLFLLLIFSSIEKRGEFDTFKRQKVYIEAMSMPEEDTMVVIKKIEANQWLYKAQWSKNTYGFFSLYPDGVLDVEEIK